MVTVTELDKAKSQWADLQSAVTEAMYLAGEIHGEAGSAAVHALRGASESVYACAQWDVLSIQASDEAGVEAEETVHQLAVKQCCRTAGGSTTSAFLGDT